MPKSSHIPHGGCPLASAANQANQAGAPMPGQSATTQGNRFGVTGTNGTGINQLDAAQADIERTFRNSLLTGIQAGVRFERDKYMSTGSRNTSLGTLAGNINPSFSSVDPYDSDLFRNTADGDTNNWPR